MREIKFRQYLENDGFFWYWGFIDGGYTAPVIINSSYDKARENSEQFTGLKDKNGKEIFEGDIFGFTVYPENNPPYMQYMVVEYKIGDSYVGFQLLSRLQVKILNGEYKGMNLYPIWENNEIIGNIHENSELLEDK